MSAINTPIQPAEREKIKSLLIPFAFPSYPEAPEGVPEVQNATVFASGYKAYPTSKNQPAALKNNANSLVKAKNLAGYDGNVVSTDEKCREGKGVQQFTDGTVLDGYWQGNRFIKGRLVTATGVTLTGVFGEDNSVQTANLKAEKYSFEGDLVKGMPKGKGRLTWNFKMFENLFAGTFEEGELKAGKVTIAMGGKVAQTIEGLIDVPFATDSLAPSLPVQRVDEPTPAPTKAQPEETKADPEQEKSSEAAPVNNGR